MPASLRAGGKKVLIYSDNCETKKNLAISSTEIFNDDAYN